MKINFLSFLLLLASFSFAQPGKKTKGPSMAPELAPGYYVTMKGDTVKGEIQINHEDECEFYNNIYFKDAKGGKVVVISSKKAKAYGYGDNHFVMMPYDNNKDVYLKYLAKGRLNFMEYKYQSTYAGKPAVAAEYYIQDTKADEANANLRELKKLSEKFYKKELRPYMKDQPMIWGDLDKYNFKPSAVANSIREYNKYYASSDSE